MLQTSIELLRATASHIHVLRNGWSKIFEQSVRKRTQYGKRLVNMWNLLW